jgi:hypothetical protein
MSVFDRVHQTYCGLHGHDSLLQFEESRLYLKCFSCGHETPGWELTETAPTSSVHTDRQPQHSLMRPQLVGARRIA